MAKSKPTTIVLSGLPAFGEEKATAAIKPGHLVELLSTGVRKQATAQANCRRTFAVENDILGKGITDEYETNSRVTFCIATPGTRILCRIAGRAPAIGVGNYLEAAADGTLRKLTSNGHAVAIALEAVNNASNTSEVFLIVEVM